MQFQRPNDQQKDQIGPQAAFYDLYLCSLLGGGL